MHKGALAVVVGVVLAVAPVAGPDVPANLLEYIEPEDEVTLVAVGDIMLSRTVAKRMQEKGPGYPFAETALFLKSADIAFGNLETPITPGRPVEPFEMSFRAEPEAAEALKDAGFDVLSLANNHTPNFGAKGLEDTFVALDAAGIIHTGAGRDDVEAGQPMFVISHGVIFAFLAYNDTDVVPAEYEAGPGHPGTAFMRHERMVAAVRAAKSYADVVIVSMHSGWEYEPHPNKRQTAFARAAVDAGAEMVVGHHPHVVQSMEVYKGKYIFYSLGNFVFDQMWSRETREGLAIRAVFTKKGLSSVSYHPVLIEDYAQPRFLEGEAADTVIERLSAKDEAAE